MRVARVILAVPVALATGGCLSVTTLVRVKADGSGTLQRTAITNPQALDVLMEEADRQAGTPKGEKPGGPVEPSVPSPQLSEAETRALAAEFGEGVTFLSLESIDKPDARGATINLAFADVRTLRINPTNRFRAGGTVAPPKPEDFVRFRFGKAFSGNPQLTVIMGGLKADPSKPSRLPKDAKELALAQRVFKGMRLLVAVDVEGTVVKSTSPFVQGSRVTLMDLEFDKLLAAPDLQRLASFLPGSVEDVRAGLKGFSGLKLTLDPEVQIEFAK
jgi:hypothetical protein